jgi:hypothetical protein
MPLLLFIDENGVDRDGVVAFADCTLSEETAFFLLLNPEFKGVRIPSITCSTSVFVTIVLPSSSKNPNASSLKSKYFAQNAYASLQLNTNAKSKSS